MGPVRRWPEKVVMGRVVVIIFSGWYSVDPDIPDLAYTNRLECPIAPQHDSVLTPSRLPGNIALMPDKLGLSGI